MKRVWLLGMTLFLGSVSFGRAFSFTEKTQAMKSFNGYFNFYWDAAEGKLWLEIDKTDQEFLYVTSLSTGLGSDQIPLDRTNLGRTRVVRFQRFGPKICLVQSNYGFRSSSENPNELKAVRDAFAESILWGFPIEAEGEEGFLVDATPFLLTDAMDVKNILKRQDGDYAIDPLRSAIDIEHTKNFPRNTEIEVILTFQGNGRVQSIRQVAPDAKSITLRQRHSFIALPDDQYTPRVHDPRSGYGSVSYLDFSSPIHEPMQKRFIRRHRLKKKNPNAETSDPVKPIIYYVDRGIPEPVRIAIMEGALWWNAAFEVAGYRNAFQVRLLPEGADPLDVHYNMINWVHRRDRGWSYGGSVTDPRTGEILKGHVLLGSQRVRQDYLIAQALTGYFTKDSTNVTYLRGMALNRIRQLSCHEVGHTLGLGHNYASSAVGRSSVMDYPHPLIEINEDGSLDLSHAYTLHIGDWDKMAIAYGYQDFLSAVNETNALQAILNTAYENGLVFLSDQDARGGGSAHPLAHLWDNGKDPVDELKRVMRIRAIALENFSEKRIPLGMSHATLEEVLVPLYLFHRYQIQAAAKVLGGVSYTYKIRGDDQPLPEIVSAQEQKRSLDALLDVLQPSNLHINNHIRDLIPPKTTAHDSRKERFQRYTGPTFDPLAAAETVANLTVGLICHPQRASRLVNHHAQNPNYPSLTEVFSELVRCSWQTKSNKDTFSEIRRMVQSIVLTHLMKLAKDDRASSQVRAVAYHQIDELKTWIEKRLSATKSTDQKAHYVYALSLIQRFQENPETFQITEPMETPQGEPIGMGDY